MIKRIRSVLKYVLAGDALDKKKYRRASELMKESKYLAGPAYSRASLFEFNLRAALAAKLNGDPNAALQEVGAAKKKIKLLNSLNDLEKEYLGIYCQIFEMECGDPRDDESIDTGRIKVLLNNGGVRQRFKRQYPVELYRP